ncbi:MAG: hypothetical protein KDB18_11415, partial [Salinibacterium sp.]|nr:hypothetical protein [Salinibacterium sp.]
FDGMDRRVEAHLIGATPAAWKPIDGLAEYGWNVRLQFLGWVRDDARFDGIDSLVAQIWRDITRAAAIVRRRTHAA